MRGENEKEFILCENEYLGVEGFRKTCLTG